jgi:hypothetical protein
MENHGAHALLADDRHFAVGFVANLIGLIADNNDLAVGGLNVPVGPSRTIQKSASAGVATKPRMAAATKVVFIVLSPRCRQRLAELKSLSRQKGSSYFTMREIILYQEILW